MKSGKNVDGYERLKIGNNIRKWRGIKGIKQKDLAASMKLSEAAISNFENDLSDITLSQMEDISLILDVSVENLFSDPQDNLLTKTYIATNTENQNGQVMDASLLYALIGTLQKKDEQIKDVLNTVMYKMDKISGDRTRSMHSS
jgi:transcriptional regulator with XRE-family HTH domain